MKQIGEQVDFTFRGKVVDIKDCREHGGPLYYKLMNQFGQTFDVSQEYLELAQRMESASNDPIPSNSTGLEYTGNDHGHVFPNRNGLKARCGGPGLCSSCAKDQAFKGGMGQ